MAEQLTAAKGSADEDPASLKQPNSSPIEVEEAADGVTLQVPPQGIWRGSKGLFVFSLFWNGFSLCNNDSPRNGWQM